MNKISTSVLLLLLGTSAAAHVLDGHLKPLGDRIRERPALMQIMADVNQWDGDIIGLVDQSYTSETA